MIMRIMMTMMMTMMLTTMITMSGTNDGGLSKVLPLDIVHESDSPREVLEDATKQL